MKTEEMKQRKRELGYSFAMLSERSGVPASTIQKIFSGETASPRYETLRALEQALLPSAGESSDTITSSSGHSSDRITHSSGTDRPGAGFYAGSTGPDGRYALPDTCGMLRESPASYNTGYRHSKDVKYPRQGSYTIEDYFALPDDQRVELIDGVFYDMSSPVSLHQLIAGEVHRQIANFILDRGGSCMAYIAPLDIQLDRDERTMVQPDVMIMCNNKEQIKNGRGYGAPDFVLEVISPSTRRRDCYLKLHKYENAGVREYWILDPYKEKLEIFFFEESSFPYICGLDQPIPVRIYNGQLEIDPKHIMRWIREWNEPEAE